MNKWMKIACIVLGILAALTAVFFVGRRFLLPGNHSEAGADGVYVQPLAEIMGSGSGMANVFSGVVESPETWSVQKNDEYLVREIFVKVGDEVKAGDKLFAYDTIEFNKELSQGEIDLERLQNELETMEKVLKQLQDALAKAPASEKTTYEIQVEEQNLEIKQKKIDIQTKELDIENYKKNIEGAEVLCGMDGIVRSVNEDNQQMYNGGENAFITVMQVDDLRVKGSLNEQNIFDVQEGMSVTVRSRVKKDLTWAGTVSKIDTGENKNSTEGENAAAASTNYSFYVTLEKSEGLMLGQHVTILPMMSEEAAADERLRLYEFYIDLSDESAPFVWVEENGKLVKRSVTLGEYNEELMEYVIEDGLTAEDKIAFPEENLQEGQKTTDVMVMEEFNEDDAADMEFETENMEEGARLG